MRPAIVSAWRLETVSLGLAVSGIARSTSSGWAMEDSSQGLITASGPATLPAQLRTAVKYESIVRERAGSELHFRRHQIATEPTHGLRADQGSGGRLVLAQGQQPEAERSREIG